MGGCSGFGLLVRFYRSCCTCWRGSFRRVGLSIFMRRFCLVVCSKFRRKFPFPSLPFSTYLCLLVHPILYLTNFSPPRAVPMNYLMWVLVGYIFSKFIKDRFRGWWLQYNFLTSAALDAGLALCTILIFLTLNLVSLHSSFSSHLLTSIFAALLIAFLPRPMSLLRFLFRSFLCLHVPSLCFHSFPLITGLTNKQTNISPPSWWGNNVVSSTLDNQNKAVRFTVNADAGETFGPPAGSW
jgi:hypothetical protein